MNGQGGVRQKLAGLPGGEDDALEGGGLAGGQDGPPCGRSGDPTTGGPVRGEGREGVGGCPGGLDIEQVVDAVAAAGGITGADGGAHMAVLNRQGDQPSRAAGDVPGQGAAEAARTDRAVRVWRDGLVRTVQVAGQLRGPVDKVLHSLAQGFGAKGDLGPLAEAAELAAEKEFPNGDDPLQHAYGGNGWGDGDPGDVAQFTCGEVVAVLVDGRLETCP
ncbi:hypothetical protein ACFWYX_28220 [[Kitasatospora] papulosa]|uniref:hypothetical protein n=1 Tax=[Kitasatospora] papulosa TaxID=1464011 RepID=UPI0036C17D91